MPFVTEYNTSLVLKKLTNSIPQNIREWKPYRKDIYFLNRLDKTNLLYFKNFCENPVENITEVYEPVKTIDKKEFVYEGGKPSYHKFESCDRLHSNFVNFRLPDKIKEKGDKAINEYREWFKEHQAIFLEKPDVYQMRLFNKYGIETPIQRVDYTNSGNIYKENLTLKEIETRIDSLLQNAAKYYSENNKRQKVIRRYQTATFLAFKEEKIEDNETGYSDDDLKEILREYYYLFIQPTIYYLKEYFKTYFNSDIEINEKIFEQLNFKRCNNCYSKDFDEKNNSIDLRNVQLEKRFGNYEFPIEPSKFYFKANQNELMRTAFFYSRVFKCLDKNFQKDKDGEFKNFQVEFINHKNKFVYEKSKIYKNEIGTIQLFKKYLTKVVQNTKNNRHYLMTYAVEL